MYTLVGGGMGYSEQFEQSSVGDGVGDGVGVVWEDSWILFIASELVWPVTA